MNLTGYALQGGLFITIVQQINHNRLVIAIIVKSEISKTKVLVIIYAITGRNTYLSSLQNSTFLTNLVSRQ